MPLSEQVLILCFGCTETTQERKVTKEKRVTKMKLPISDEDKLWLDANVDLVDPDDIEWFRMKEDFEIMTYAQATNKRLFYMLKNTYGEKRQTFRVNGGSISFRQYPYVTRKTLSHGDTFMMKKVSFFIC